jgi:hypothetical protein
MQHAVFNFATIRVAETTEVSGRVTADEVNLDRFHNPIRKVCALGRTWLALVAASVGLYLVLPDRGLAQSITVATLKGTYVTAPTGSITLRPSGEVVQITLAGVETFLGDGTASGEITLALVFPGGSIVSGIHETFTATYTRNADGVSFTAINTNPANPEDMNTEVLYPTLDGSTFTSNQTTPGSFLSAVWTRSSGKALLNP